MEGWVPPPEATRLMYHREQLAALAAR